MYLRRMDLSNIEARIVRDVDPERFRKITSSTLEGLAKRELNLGALLGKSAEARARRLIPEVIEDFFVAAGPIVGVHPKAVQKDGHVYRVGKVPRTLQPVGERLEPRFGRLGREYQKVVFDKPLNTLRSVVTMAVGQNPVDQAKSSKTSYSEVRRQAERLGPLWT